MELKKKGIHLTFLRIFSFKQPKGVIGLAEEEENTHTHTHTHTLLTLLRSTGKEEQAIVMMQLLAFRFQTPTILKKSSRLNITQSRM